MNDLSTPGKVIYLMGSSLLDRLAYRQLLAQLKVEVTLDSGFSPTAVWAALRTPLDLVVVDADMPTPEVVDAVEMLTRLRPDARVLILTSAVQPMHVESWAHCPMHGYVVKDGGCEELRVAIEALLTGQTYYSAGIRAALDRAAAREQGAGRLSPREAELLPLLARGMTLRDAAAQLSISYKTADSYRSSLLRKLGVRDRVELVRYAIRMRIIEP